MDRLFDKKSKKSSKLSRNHIFLGIPTNIAAGPLGFRAELGADPKGEQRRSCHDFEADGPDLTVALDEKTLGSSRIVFHDNKSRDQVLPAPETSTPADETDGTEDENDPIGESFRHPAIHASPNAFSYRRGRC